MIRLTAALVAFAVLLTPAGMAAQEDQDPIRFAGATHLVVLHVGVTDRGGQYRTGLSQDAFAVFEDGVRQDVRFFSNEDLPATVGLLVDSSISMWSIRDLVIAASAEFARASHPEDELFALAFNETVRSALPEDAPFTSDVEHLRTTLAEVVTARGRTALFDAISQGITYAAQGTHPRKVLVVLSDGGDNASRATLDEVITKTQTSNLVIYTVALFDPTSREANPKLLERLAVTTGGLHVRPDDDREVADALQWVARDIRHSYVLGYVPTRPLDGTFRKVEVRVTSPDRQRVVVRTRQGYLAEPSPPQETVDAP